MPRKNLVHFPVGHTPVHINYRLHGSIPKQTEQHLTAWHDAQLLEINERLAGLPSGLYCEARQREISILDRKLEAATEKALHQPMKGPTWLAQVALRATVLESWQFLAERGEIDLHSCCVMSNHVHVILSQGPGGNALDVGSLMCRHKTFTARECNLLRQTTGQPFWAAKYFDRTVRQGKWLVAMWYVLNNPVKARIVTDWQQWSGTYVNPKYLSHFLD